ncbi:MAG: hypothetical protein Crog4KO_18830 [Crocinitomicaceae bacterium]
MSKTKDIIKILSQSEKVLSTTAAGKINSLNKELEKTSKRSGAIAILMKMQNESPDQKLEELLPFSPSAAECLNNGLLAQEMEKLSNPLSKAMSIVKNGNEAKRGRIPKESNTALSSWHKMQEIEALTIKISQLKQEKEVIEKTSILESVVEDYLAGRLENEELSKTVLLGDEHYIDDELDEEYLHFEGSLQYEDSLNEDSLNLGGAFTSGLFNVLGLIAESIRQSDIVYINKQIRSLERCSAKARSAIYFTDEGRDGRKKMRRYSLRMPPNNMDEEDFQIIPTYKTFLKRNLIWKSNENKKTIRQYYFAA